MLCGKNAGLFILLCVNVEVLIAFVIHSSKDEDRDIVYKNMQFHRVGIASYSVVVHKIECQGSARFMI